MSCPALIAVDIGNARIKLGLFAARCAADPAAALPEPARTLSLDGHAPQLQETAAWLGTDGEGLLSWWIASVDRPATTRLIDWCREHRPDDRIVLLGAEDLPLAVRLERADMVGVDRLVDAVAANRLRAAGRPAVVVDVGTAITVDWVAADGAFQGGAILPGLRMAARGLHEFTDLLPLVDVAELAAPPPALGTDTVSAMRSGLLWGTIGGIRQVIEQLTTELAEGEPSPSAHPAGPHVFLTGGASPVVARLLGRGALHVPNLTLSGIALSASQLRS